MATEQQQIKAIVRGMEDVGAKVVKKITLDVTANLIETTPRDTGWARNNWVPNIGSPYAGEPGSNPSEAGVAAARGQQESGTVQVATSYTLDRGAVFVSNNVPYINRLNDGSSKQEPAGFVQRAVMKAVTEDLL